MVLANLEDVNVVDGKVNALSNNLPRNYYNKSEVDQKISEIPAGKDYDDQIAEINSELGNRYTKAQTDKKISDEIKKIPVPKDYDEDIERIDGELDNRYTKSETYTQTEVQEYVAQHGGESVPDDIVLWENPTEVEVPATSQPLHRFSSEEKVVGYWVNGKPLYEKTLVFDDIQKSSSSEISLEHGIEDVEYIFTDYTNTMFLQSDGHASPINVRWSTSSMSAYDSIIFGAYTNFIRYRVGASTVITGLQITLRYTKTTDRGND